MADLSAATLYIQANVIDIDDWNEAGASKQGRILNVASRILSDTYPSLSIPDEAVYEFCPVLAAATNDTNKLNAQGIAAFSITGVGSFTFNGAKSPEELIPASSRKLISRANGDIPLSGATTGRATLKYRV